MDCFDNSPILLIMSDGQLNALTCHAKDTDFAAETTNLAKQQIIEQASVAMLVQANASKQNILTLMQT